MRTLATPRFLERTCRVLQKKKKKKPMTNQSREIEKHPTLQIQLDISIIIRPLTMFFLKVHTLSLSLSQITLLFCILFI